MRPCFRPVDVNAMLAEPDVGVGWRCEGFVADGTLTLLAGSAGDGKTFLAHGLAAAVARGEDFAGIPCAPGKAIVVDAEMGARMTIKRWRIQGIGSEVGLIDATGFNLADAADLAYLAEHIAQREANFVVLDSLRRLTPGRAENNSDDMAPIVGSLANLAHESNAAIVLIHHRGKGNEGHAYRGSTAIGDQVDAVFNLTREVKLLGKAGRRLSCVDKMRYAPEPEDRFLEFAPERGGFVETDGPTTDEQLRADILRAAPAPTVTALAERVGRHPGHARFKRLYNQMTNGGLTLVVPEDNGSSNSTQA